MVFNDPEIELKTIQNQLKDYDKTNTKDYYYQAKKEHRNSIAKPKKRGSKGRSSTNTLTKRETGNEPDKTAPSSTFNEEWFDMEDSELIRHLCRMVILDSNSSYKDKLDASAKLMSLKEKTGTLDLKTKSETEVMDKFKQLPTQSLINLLSKSSQEGQERESF